MRMGLYFCAVACLPVANLAEASHRVSETLQVTWNLETISRAIQIYHSEGEKVLPLKDQIKHLLESHSTVGESVQLRRVRHERFLLIVWIQTILTVAMIVFGATLLIFRASYLKRRTRWLALFVGIVVVGITYEMTPSVLNAVLTKPTESRTAFVDDFDFVPGVQYSDSPEQVVAIERVDLRPNAREICVLTLRGFVHRVPREQISLLSTRPSPPLPDER